jgi:hypothetical protein
MATTNETFELSKEYNFMWLWGFSQKNFTKSIKSCPWNLKMLDFFQCPLVLLVTMPFSEWDLTFIKWMGRNIKASVLEDL